MVRTIASLSIGIALTVAAAGAAQAQSMPAAPLPGTGDSGKIAAGNRDNNAAYNQLIGGVSKNSQTTTKANGSAPSSAVAATAADIKVGSALRDIKGVHIGTVSQVDPDGVVVDTGTTKIKVPTSGFGKDDQGLLLNVTAARFNELIAKAQAAH
jgi:hypothetical protein